MLLTIMSHSVRTVTIAMLFVLTLSTSGCDESRRSPDEADVAAASDVDGESRDETIGEDLRSDSTAPDQADSDHNDVEDVETGSDETIVPNGCEPLLPGHRVARVGDVCCTLVPQPFAHAACDDGRQITVRETCQDYLDLEDVDLSERDARITFAVQGCTEIAGNLWLVGDHDEIEGLDSLERVGGALLIENHAESLAPLSGLEQLGALFIENPRLETLDGLNPKRFVWTSPGLPPSGVGPLDLNLLRVDRLRDLTALRSLEPGTELNLLLIRYANELTTLAGLESVRALHVGAAIYENPKLVSLEGLSTVVRVGSLAIDSNESLDTVALPALREVDWDLEIIVNPALTEVRLPALQRVIHDIVISYNLKLERLGPMPELMLVGGRFLIQGTDRLTSITGLGGGGRINSLAISDHLTLEEVALRGLEHGSVNIADCPALTSITALGRAGTRLSSLTLSRLENLASVNGIDASWEYVSVNGLESLVSLEPLHVVVDSKGGVGTGGFSVKESPRVETLPSVTATRPFVVSLRDTGLENLDELTGVSELAWLTLFENKRLTDLSGLEHLVGIDQHLMIWGNPLLTDLTALTGLTHIGQQVSVRNNPMLPTCQAQAIVDGLESPPQTVTIEGNDDTVPCR